MGDDLERIIPETESQTKPSSKYPALQIIIRVFLVLGWLLILAAGLLAICAISFLSTNPFVGIISTLAGVLISVLPFAIAESIKVLIDIEANTRKIAEVK